MLEANHRSGEKAVPAGVLPQPSMGALLVVSVSLQQRGEPIQGALPRDPSLDSAVGVLLAMRPGNCRRTPSDAGFDFWSNAIVISRWRTAQPRAAGSRIRK